MCGICGQIGGIVNETSGNRAVQSLRHRGPDSQNIVLEEGVFLGHARLAIIDLLERSNQPMRSFNTNNLIVFNGEIYNYLEIKEELKERGVEFQTSSDTEVILLGYEVFGKDIFQMLNGVFAICIWDKQERKALLARDRYGVKPLYIREENGSLKFASESKAILAINENTSEYINRQAFTEFLWYGAPTSSQTLFEGIRELDPGELMEWSESSSTASKFWKVQDKVEINRSESEAVASLRQMLDDAVKRQLIADVPVGVFLSGGVDSSLVTALAAKYYGGKLKTYTASFEYDKGVNELAKAKKVAEQYGTEHHELFIEGKDLPQVTMDLVKHHDAPFSDAANIPLYLLTRALNGDVKVILQGDGGDEFFGGYRRYALLSKYGSPMYQQAFALGTSVSKLVQSTRTSRQLRIIDALGSTSGLRMAKLLTQDSAFRNLTQLLSPSAENKILGFNPFGTYEYWNKELNALDPVQRMLYTDTQVILPRIFLEKVDKSTMANSVEVRVPMLDNLLTEFAFSTKSNLKVKDGQKKYLLRQACRGIVPDEILDGKKTGFGVPFENWVKGPLKELYFDNLSSAAFQSLDLIDTQKFEKYWKEHESGAMNNGFLHWKLMNFAIWVNTYKVSFK